MSVSPVSSRTSKAPAQSTGTFTTGLGPNSNRKKGGFLSWWFLNRKAAKVHLLLPMLPLNNSASRGMAPLFQRRGKASSDMCVVPASTRYCCSSIPRLLSMLLSSMTAQPHVATTISQRIEPKTFFGEPCLLPPRHHCLRQH